MEPVITDTNVTSKYKVSSILGKGAYGIVYKAKNLETGDEVAIKACFDCFRNRTDGIRVFREISYLQQFAMTWNSKLRTFESQKE